MTRLTEPGQIWTVTATSDELRKGAEYAEVTLPWTFNRLMLNTGSSGQQERGLNIAKGIVAQKMLVRALQDKGLPIEEQVKSHRNEDLFDLSIPVNGSKVKFDLKSVNYYSDYAPMGRDALTPELVIKNADYPGPEWHRFFPMLVPHTQIDQDKEAYCFAIAESIDPRNNPLHGREAFHLVAFPYGIHLPFFTSKRLCQMREQANQGFYITVEYEPVDLLAAQEIEFALMGEWGGEAQRVTLTLTEGQTIDVEEPFSCLSSFKISRKSYEEFPGRIKIKVVRNDYNEPFLNTKRKDVNVPPKDEFCIHAGDFCNLYLPEPYVLHLLGWIERHDFLERYLDYPAWVWPKDSVDKYSNQRWERAYNNDQSLMTKLGQNLPNIEDTIPAGLMKTTGRGGGACCYVFPNVFRRGGVSETNLYVLPQDLKPMDTLLPNQ